MLRVATLAFVLVIALSSVGHACWSAIDPSAFAEITPIIVTGTIEKVVQAKPGGQRDDDIATIRVDKVHRNELKDIAVRPGDAFQVRMISNNNRMRTSTDLNYAVNTKATWLIVLNTKGQFRIDIHPVQKQDDKPGFKMVDRVERMKKEPEVWANPAGSKTTEEWIAWRVREEARRAKELADYRDRQQAIRDLAKQFADPNGVNAKVWQRYHAANSEVRLSMFQLSEHEQPMSGPRFAEVVRETLKTEKDPLIRTHAVCRLGYSRDPGEAGVAALTDGLNDESADVRMFACQSIKQRNYRQLIPQVKMLQKDPNAQVREMATHTLEHWERNPAK